MLRAALGVATIPAGGLDMPGAREKSAEQIVVEMRRNGDAVSSRTRVWDGEVTIAGPRVRPAGRRQQRAPGTDESGDVLGEAREREMFPDDAADQARRAKAIGELAAKGLALGKAMGAMRGRGSEAGAARQLVDALRGIYRTPWQMALQTWLEGVVPGERTFVRPSRRGADRERRRDARPQAPFLDAQCRARYLGLDERRDPARARRHRGFLRCRRRSTRSASCSATPR